MCAAKVKARTDRHQVLTVTEHGWSGITNGQLLTLAEAEFDVFLTVDQNLRYQQNLTDSRIAIILLVARNNRLKTLLPLMPEVREVLKNVKIGDFVQVGKS